MTTDRKDDSTPQAAQGLISIDIGTSSVKAMLCSAAGVVAAQASASYPCYFPQPGWVEQDADEVLAGVVKAIAALAAHAGGRVEAIVFGGIWQSCLPLDHEDRPLCRALIWSDQRSAQENALLRSRLSNEDVRSRTGCALHPMYFLSRILWFKQQAPGLYARAARFVSIKEYILSRLHGVRVVDRSMASGTGAWNMAQRDWDRELLAAAGVGEARFSDCVEPVDRVGALLPAFAQATGLLAGTPAIAGAADGALAHLGAVGMAEGRMSFSAGTSIALRIRSAQPQVTPGSEAWCYYLADGQWLRGGVAHGGGNALKWFAENILGARPEEQESIFDRMNELAGQAAPGAGGLRFFPLFGGERCPNYRPDARGAIAGLSFNHGRAELSRALYEGLSFGVRAIYRMLAGDARPGLVVTGGILKSPVWLQILADCLGQPLWRPAVDESAAWGGAVLGLKAIGAYPDLAAASSALVRTAGAIEPAAAQRAAHDDLMAGYERAYARMYAD
jgi:gluconokinase